MIIINVIIVKTATLIGFLEGTIWNAVTVFSKSNLNSFSLNEYNTDCVKAFYIYICVISVWFIIYLQSF